MQVLSNSGVQHAGGCKSAKQSQAPREPTGGITEFRASRLAAFSTTSATTPGGSAEAMTSVSVAQGCAHARYSSIFESGSRKFASKRVFV